MNHNLPPGVTPDDIDRHFGDGDDNTETCDICEGAGVYETGRFDEAGEEIKEECEECNGEGFTTRNT